VASLINALGVNPTDLENRITAPGTTELDAARGNMLTSAPGLSHQDRINRAVTDLARVTRKELDAGGPGVTVGDARSRAEGLGVGSELSATRDGTTVEGELLQALTRGRGLSVADQIRNLDLPTMQGTDLTGLSGSPEYEMVRQAYQGDINEVFRQQGIALEDSLASRGVLNSTIADEARQRLAGEKARASAMADLEALKVIGAERRADLGTAAGIRGSEFGQQLGGAELGLRGAGLLGSEERANLGAFGGAAQALQQAQLQNLGFGSQQALARGGEERANLGLLSNVLGQDFGQNLAQRQFESGQAQARGAEARADLGALGQEATAGLQRALARGDFTTGQAQALSGLASDEQARELQRLGFGSQQALAQFGLGAQQAGLAQAQANAVAQAEQFGAGQEMAVANLQFQQSLQEAGLERGDIERSVGIINQRFSQNMAEGRFDLDAAQVEIQRDLQEAGLQQANAEQFSRLAAQDFANAMQTAQFNWMQNAAQAQFRAGQAQQDFANQLQALLAGENIFGQRLGQAQQPLGMLLSALAGTNVAPGVLGPMQLPQQTPGAGEKFGGFLGNLISNTVPATGFIRGLGD
jgi:hypothetical protein